MPVKREATFLMFLGANRQHIFLAIFLTIMASIPIYLELDSQFAERIAQRLNLQWWNSMQWTYSFAVLVYAAMCLPMFGAILLQRQYRFFTNNRLG